MQFGVFIKLANICKNEYKKVYFDVPAFDYRKLVTFGVDITILGDFLNKIESIFKKKKQIIFKKVKVNEDQRDSAVVPYSTDTRITLVPALLILTFEAQLVIP